MTNSIRLTIVRACFDAWLAAESQAAESQAAESQAKSTADSNPAVSIATDKTDELAAPASPVRESILIRDGFYCGRCFVANNHRAVWFIEEDQLKIYNTEGRVVDVLESDAISNLAAPIVASHTPVASIVQDAETKPEPKQNDAQDSTAATYPVDVIRIGDRRPSGDANSRDADDTTRGVPSETRRAA